MTLQGASPPIIQPVILSGGSGTRLWPLSTAERPKQFLPLTDERTMFELTLGRCPAAGGYAPPMMVGNAAHAELAGEQMARAGVAGGRLILEPAARNTAPAIALAAMAVEDPATPLLVMPSDHAMTDEQAFRDGVAAALGPARDGWLVTFGIRPSGPETGYGYIRLGEPIADGVHAAARFVEKPSEERAAAMLAEGGHAWNAGIFLFRADAYLAALGHHAPEIVKAVASAWHRREERGGLAFPAAEPFADCPAESIDYAVMEKAERVAVTPIDPGWSDVGSWDSLGDLRRGREDCDECGNVVAGDALLLDSANTLVLAEDGVRVSGVGLEDLIVIARAGEVMILPRGRSQDVKRIAQHRG